MSGQGPHFPPSRAAASTKCPTKVGYRQFAAKIWAQKPDTKPTNIYSSCKQSMATQAVVFGKISQWPQPDFKIVSVSIFPCQSLGVRYRAQRRGRTQDWLTGGVDLRVGLAWHNYQFTMALTLNVTSLDGKDVELIVKKLAVPDSQSNRVSIYAFKKPY